MHCAAQHRRAVAVGAGSSAAGRGLGWKRALQLPTPRLHGEDRRAVDGGAACHVHLGHQPRVGRGRMKIAVDEVEAGNLIY
jgi:hypothetical protein